MIVLVTDNRGGILDNKFVPLSHRIELDGQTIHGAENLYRQFTKAEWTMIANLIYALPVGSYSSISWHRE